MREVRVLLASLLVLAIAVPAAEAAKPRAAQKVTICHRVGGPNYVAITPASVAALKGHAKNHPLDIIPAFTYVERGETITFPGQNLTEEGLAILGNQCVVPPDSSCTRAQARNPARW